MPMTGGPYRNEPAVPIAVVGLACRLPHAPDPEAFWRLLREERSAITPVPDGRWPGAAPDGLPRYGGFLDDIAGFDAEFFGIGATEAAAMDPQQRLALELGWEALADAGRPVPGHERDTGVFLGAIWDDYAHLVLRQGPAALTAYSMTGLNRGVVANRLSHVFGLRGPSMVVDTGQSSSLIAVHLAVESLRRGECAFALAGGVNLMLLTDAASNAARMGALSPRGQCFTFDARADGYVRGEGAAVVALKPLPRAVVDGDRIYCVILGSAVNSDGATGTIALPDALAQEELLRLAYRRAGVAPCDVQYVELHGTGTPTGDPIEAAALGAALGASRPDDAALLVGSAKTNVGHLEGAAGVVGLVKVAMSVAQRTIPASLNFARPNPAIPLRELGLAVAARTTTWPRPDRRLVAGVSAFGMGGTNCHLVLAERPAGARRHGPSTPGADYHRRRFWFDTEPAPSDRGTTLETVCAHTATVLGLPGGAELDPERSFQQLGLNSMDLVELTARLTGATGVPLGETAVFDHPTPAQLARRLDADLIGEPAVLDDLDRLAASAARIRPGDRVLRASVADRLRALLAVLADDALAEPNGDAAAHVMTASSEELFALIDRGEPA